MKNHGAGTHKKNIQHSDRLLIQEVTKYMRSESVYMLPYAFGWSSESG